jgi:phenylacetate-CoA ligase
MSERLSFLRIILEKADELGVALPFLRKALVSAEAFPKSFCDALITSRHPGIPGRMRPRTSARSPTRRRAREGLVIDEGVVVRDRPPGDRRFQWPKAKWERSS